MPTNFNPCTVEKPYLEPKATPPNASWWAQPGVQADRATFNTALSQRNIDAGWKASGKRGREVTPTGWR